MEKKRKKKEAGKTDLGIIRIHNEVISAIASLATLEIKGVAAMSSTLAEGLAHILGKKEFEKGVKVEINENKTKINVSVIVRYGSYIPEVVSKIQKNIKKNVEEMTGLKLEEVNINVQGIALKEAKKGIKNGKTKKMEAEK